MRLHVIEHEPLVGPTNIDFWADKNGQPLSRTFLAAGDTLPDLDDLDWLVVAGGSQHVWEDDLYPWLKAEKEFIRQALKSAKVVLGICFGAQLLAEALGSLVYKAEHEEIGWATVTLTEEGQKSPLCRFLPDSFPTFHWHADHFYLPPDCQRLASSSVTPNQFMASRKYAAVGIQFHPEFTLETVAHYAREESGDWTPGSHVSDPAEVLATCDRLPETTWLMEIILDNMAEYFSSPEFTGRGLS